MTFMKNLFALIFVFSLSACSFMSDIFPDPVSGHSSVDKGITAFNTANYQQALEYMTEPAEQGNMDAQYIVGMIYLYGLSGVKDCYTAQKWLHQAAQSGQRAAQEQLAFLYMNRFTPLYNPIDAYFWFSVIIGDHPQHREEMQNLKWSLQNNGLLSEVDSIPMPEEKRYKGVDYNDLFPLR